MAGGKTKDGLEYLWTDKKRTLFGLPLSFTRYYLTDTRLITRVGFLTITEDELDIYRITDKKMELPLGQRDQFGIRGKDMVGPGGMPPENPPEE